MRGDQHNDHCILTVKDTEWRIIGIADKLLTIQNIYHPELFGLLDISTADIDGYVERATADIKMRMYGDFGSMH